MRSHEAKPSEHAIHDLIERYVELHNRGEAPSIHTFARRYPEHAEALRKLIPASLMLSDLTSAAGDIPVEESAAVPKLLGDFRIVRELGRGGMGVVYEAEQMSLRRRVAIKVLPFAGMLSANQLQRFKNEALAAASLQHPNIVSAFFVGYERGVHFYAMRLIDGCSLGEVVAAMRSACDPTSARCGDVQGMESLSTQDQSVESPPTVAETTPLAALSTAYSCNRNEFFRSVARLGIEASDALEYAHSMGVVHRDIKPSNLMVDRDGHLWVTDFGLAATQLGADVTLSGELLGTLRYMSPEQAGGNRSVDQRADLYSLGISLYELLSLRCPWDAEDRGALLQQVLEDEPTPLRNIDRSIPTDLETILLKAIAKEPALRYSNAAEFSADLRRFVRGEPIHARRLTRYAVLTKWVQRNRLLFSFGVTTLALLVAISIVSPIVAIRYGQMARRESAARADSETDRNRLKQILNETLHDFAAAIEGHSGLENAHAETINRVILYNERLLREQPNDTDTQLEAGTAYRKLAFLLAEANDRPTAHELFEKSREILAPMVAAGQLWPDSQGELAMALAGAAYCGTDPQLRCDQARQATDFAAEVVRISDSPQNLQCLVECRSLLGRRLSHLGQMSESVLQLRLAEDEGRALLAKTSSIDARMIVARAYRSLADRVILYHHFREAENLYREALKLQDDRGSYNARNAEALAADRCGLAYTLNRMRRPDEALDTAELTIDGLQHINSVSPQRRYTVLYLGISHYEKAIAHLQKNDNKAAEAALRTSLEFLSTVSAREHTLASRSLGQLLWRTGHTSNSTDIFSEIMLRIQCSDGSVSEPRALAAILLLAPEHFDPQRALELCQTDFMEEVGSEWQLLALAQARNGQWQSAKDSLSQALTLRSGGDPFDWFLFAIVEGNLGNYAESLRWRQRAETAKEQHTIELSNFVLPQQLSELQEEARQVIPVGTATPANSE